jgi:hypothetical protein
LTPASNHGETSPGYAETMASAHVREAGRRTVSPPGHTRTVQWLPNASRIGRRDAGTLSAAAVLTLQHLAGNQAVTRLLQSWNPMSSHADTAIVQRNEESTKLLTKLATPQVLPGPEVKVQDEIVAGMAATARAHLPESDRAMTASIISRRLRFWPRTR